MLFCSFKKLSEPLRNKDLSMVWIVLKIVIKKSKIAALINTQNQYFEKPITSTTKTPKHALNDDL